MSTLSLKPVALTNFSLEPKFEANVLCIQVSGNGDLDAVESLGSYLPQIHTACEALGAAEVHFDFRELQFMNSSCFKAFVTFIDRARNTDARYHIRFITTARHYWQRRSLEALRRLALGMVSIQPEP